MADFISEYGFLFGIGTFMIAIFPLAAYMAKRQKEKFKQAAMQLGLQYNEGIKMPLLGVSDWNITGEYEGSQVFFETIRQGSGKSKRTYTRFRAYFAQPFNSDLHISREGLGSKLMQKIKGKDIQTGNPDFDGKFLLKASPEANMIPVLSRPDLQQALIKFFDDFKGSHIQDDAVVFTARGTVHNIDRLRTILGEMTRLSKMFKA
ncbi:hypothetical protein HN748_06345 [Candidatus Peregrinibacteria bacterium]|jgi:hypothetical protein|nr:hypothetical protein [Candidatus Peregrinibacteria bacterium]MBT7484515.1 hypothetical protein [Candidatus Peregrinibacteria bacterium]MBT7703823.1 hypothetical protein [Candidatus Peregrinibacteria bacterium]